MSRNAEKKSADRFRKGFTIYLVVLSLLLAAALGVLWYAMQNHQNAVDADAAQEAAEKAQKAQETAEYRAPQLAFEEYLGSLNTEFWVERWYSDHPESLDDLQKVTDWMNEQFYGENARVFKAEEYTAEAPVFVLKNGDERLATVTLSGSGTEWEVSETKLLFTGEYEASVEVPAGCTVYCNGQPLGEEYASDTHSYFDSEDYQDQLVNPVLWSTYSVSGQLFEPELLAEAPADRTLSVAENGDMNYVLSADAAEAYQTQGEQFIRTLLFYYMMGGSNTWANMSAALNLVVPRSQAWTLVNDSYNGVTWDASYPNATYEVTAGPVYLWADNCLSMDVVYHSEGTTNGYTNVADGTYRLYFLDSGSGFGICGLSFA